MYRSSHYELVGEPRPPSTSKAQADRQQRVQKQYSVALDNLRTENRKTKKELELAMLPPVGNVSATVRAQRVGGELSSGRLLPSSADSSAGMLLTRHVSDVCLYFPREGSQAPNDLRLIFPRPSGPSFELWTNAFMLSPTSPYFKTPLESSFAEAKKGERVQTPSRRALSHRGSTTLGSRVRRLG